MKRASRRRALDQLYADVESADYDKREFAMLQLALLLRRDKRTLTAGDWSEQDSAHLSRHLRRIRLSRADETQAVACLARVTGRQAGSRATALWALGEASAEIGAPALLAAILKYGDQLNEEAAYQACRALRTWLEPGDLDAGLGRDALTESDPSAALSRWSASVDGRLAKSAIAVIDALGRLKN